MAKSMDFFQKILEAEREKCLAGQRPGIAISGERTYERSGLAQSSRNSLRVKPAAAVLESYAMTGSNREQRNLAFLSAKILTEDLSILTVLNPSLKALIDECSSEL